MPKKILLEVIFSAEARGVVAYRDFLFFTRDKFILKLEFVSRALSKIGIQSMKLYKVMYVYC